MQGLHIFDEGVNDRPAEKGVVSDPDTSSNATAHRRSTDDVTKNLVDKEPGKHPFYGDPLLQHTGIWVPVSVPPMTEKDREEWHRGFGPSGGYFPQEEFGWELDEDNKEMTMWDVFSEMVVVAKDKVISVTSCDFQKCGMSVVSNFFLQEAWKDMAQTLADANAGIATELLEAEPTKWLPDSTATSCMLCGVRFHPIMCSRHHCRFCGGLFCNACSKGRSLMPPKFKTSEPQRVCDVCGVRLESIQPYLMNEVSRASQLPAQDVTDLSTLRSWLNFPWAHTMEYEIYKAANSLRTYYKVCIPFTSIQDCCILMSCYVVLQYLACVITAGRLRKHTLLVLF
jgi:SH3 domain-containing YSC84-like protein 1